MPELEEDDRDDTAVDENCEEEVVSDVPCGDVVSESVASPDEEEVAAWMVVPGTRLVLEMELAEAVVVIVTVAAALSVETDVSSDVTMAYTVVEVAPQAQPSQFPWLFWSIRRYSVQNG